MAIKRRLLYISTFDCHIVDKAIVYNDLMVAIKVSKDMRSCYAKCVYYNYSHVRICEHRDREPSRG